MSVIEVLSGDFEAGTTRIRYSRAGRAHVRLTSVDGRSEDLFLETDVVGAALTSSAARTDCRFTVTLRDGRAFTARSACDVVEQFRIAAMPPRERAAALARRAAAVRDDEPSAPAGLLPRFVPDLLGRLLPGMR